MTDLGIWGRPTSPYHQGEQVLHERYGRLDEQTAIARQIHAPMLHAEHGQFLEILDYVVLGSIDGDDRPWGSIIFGNAGFAHAPDTKTIQLDAAPMAGDRLNDNMVVDSPMSVVGIDLSTRRRIRSNVTFAQNLEPGLRLLVDQAYGNCPKYIQTRQLAGSGGAALADEPAGIETFASFTEEAAALIERADTFFVASYNNVDDQHDVGGVDINHRGGRAGFVKVDGDSLIVPDYIGNFAFNTLGNFLVNPVAGLLFVDFESGGVLQLTGTAEILWEDDPAIADFRGAQRGWRFTLEEGQLIVGAIEADWEFGAYSPSSLRTGTWSEVGS